MSNVPAWFERTFEFTFPVEQYLNLCIRLRGTPARLEEIVRGVPRDVLIHRAGDKWSAQEHAGHLLDLEPLWAACRASPSGVLCDVATRRDRVGSHCSVFSPRI